MKRIVFLFLMITFSTYSQEKERSVSMYNNDTIVDSSAVYNETLIGKVDTRDSVCFSEIERAKSDFAEGNFTYYDYKGYGSRIRNIDYFQNEIEKLKIKYELVLVGCMSGTIVTKTFIPRDNCYRSCMQRLVENKYRKDFFKDLNDKSDSLYVLANLNKVFISHDCDQSIRYKKSINKKYNEQFQDVEKDLNIVVIYPNDFKYKNEKYYSWTTCDFIINIDGTISDLEIETEFQNRYNKKFKKYFETILKDFVLKSEWLPASSNGINVKSEWSVTLQYK